MKNHTVAMPVGTRNIIPHASAYPTADAKSKKFQNGSAVRQMLTFLHIALETFCVFAF